MTRPVLATMDRNGAKILPPGHIGPELDVFLFASPDSLFRLLKLFLQALFRSQRDHVATFLFSGRDRR
jgi:hypothetical protein